MVDLLLDRLSVTAGHNGIGAEVVRQILVGIARGEGNKSDALSVQENVVLADSTRASANDILFVAAAGNNSSNNDTTPFYPASYTAPKPRKGVGPNGGRKRRRDSDFAHARCA